MIERLLAKDPDHRLGSAKGAAEIKRHPFFKETSSPCRKVLTATLILNYSSDCSTTNDRV
ncbi:Protein kinase PINOID [Platanthera guangdongensis]|uniref:Protein kinase PINOID n=1 Tax=Platanthera guangdongensis TaxID=2320717 RepID=A0ABR2M779_9ASPA